MAAGIGLLILSLCLLVAGCGAYVAAVYLSYWFENVHLAHSLFTIICLFLFMLSLMVAVLSSVDKHGKLQSPDTFPKLTSWASVLLQATFSIGVLANYQSSLEIGLATAEMVGDEAFYLGDGTAILDGTIGSETFQSITRTHGQYGLSRLILNSGGGFLDEAEAIGAFVNEKGIETIVESYCESACVIVALSGISLSVSANAQFGFHQGSAGASFDSELGKYVSKVATEDLLAKLKLLGVPGTILAIAEKTAPEEMHYVSGEEMIRTGLARPWSE